jgi:two-component system phosphate regulon sensor histidine kinase PhoR
MILQKFFWKTFLSLVCAIVISAIFFGGILHKRLYTTTLSTFEENLKKQTEVLAMLAESSPDILRDPQKIARVVHTDDRITVMDMNGVVLADNWAERIGKEAVENHANRPEFQAALKEKPIFVRRVSRTVEREMLYYAIPLKTGAQIVSVLRLSFPLTTFYEQMRQVRHFLILAALFAVLLSLPFAYLLSRTITVPLETLRQASLRLASGDLDHRVTVYGSKEFSDLAGAFNKMAEELRQKIRSLQQQQTRIETLLANMVEGVLVIDSSGKTVFANQSFCDMVGYDQDRIHGRPFLEISRSEEFARLISELLISEERLFRTIKEVRLFGPAGEKIYSVQASTILQPGIPDEALLLLVFHDITKIRRVEQIRKDFVANVSHELRTPLTSLKGSLEALMDGALNDEPQRTRFLQIMEKQVENIQNIVDDMLRLAAVEDSRVPLQREIIEVRALFHDVTTIIQPLAKKKQQILDVALPQVSLRLNVDGGQIAEALINLLENAVKYSGEKATIHLRAAAQGDGVTLEVSDDGPGIPAEHLPRIFERFYRIDKSRSREIGGTGLGLSIVKHVVENHGGSIEVHSELGRGTSFVIHLPEVAMAVHQISGLS